MKSIPQNIVEATADAIMENFIPKDAKSDVFEFNFTIPPANNYKATYQKSDKGVWKLYSCTAVD
jgi:formaldehyde-activating enzyme involved in methanogenesis